MALMVVTVEFRSEMFHTLCEVWNKYGTWKGAWMLVLPYLPYLPYLPSPARMRAWVRVCACARVCEYSFLSMEGMEVWKMVINKGSTTSILVPYLVLGVEGWFFIGGING